MLTTQNIYREEAPAPSHTTTQSVPKTLVSTVAERMRKMREAKLAKKAQREAKAQAPTTTGAAPSNPDGGTPAALSTQATEQLQTILRELNTMFGYGSPHGHELCAKALALLEAHKGPAVAGGGTTTF